MLHRPFLCALILSVSIIAARVSSAQEAPATPPPQDSPEAMLAKLQNIQPPKVDQSKLGDPAYVESLVAQQKVIMKDHADMAQEFVKKYPDHAMVPQVTFQRWMLLIESDQTDLAMTETEEALKKPDLKNRSDVLLLRAIAMIKTENVEKLAQAVDAFIAENPKDERGPRLLMNLAMLDQTRREAIEARIAKEYPDFAKEMADSSGNAGDARQKQAIGKPFELSFKDAISGAEVSMASLKGKVVVIDFWATWCGPCIAEMPNMKLLYAKYKPQGVEFIGVSLDQPVADGGLDALKKYVTDNKITWPQYYQGSGWESEFSKGWGIMGIPTVFIVDADGNLADVEARGRLETLIPRLIAKRDSTKPPTN